MSLPNQTPTAYFAILLLLLAGAVCTPTTTVVAQSNDTIVFNPPKPPKRQVGYWYNPPYYVTAKSKIAAGGATNNASVQSDSQWLNAPLQLKAGSKITGFKVCYTAKGSGGTSQTAIVTAVRLLEVLPNGKAVVRYTKPINSLERVSCDYNTYSYKANTNSLIVALQVPNNSAQLLSVSISSVEPIYE